MILFKIPTAVFEGGELHNQQLCQDVLRKKKAKKRVPHTRPSTHQCTSDFRSFSTVGRTASEREPGYSQQSGQPWGFENLRAKSNKHGIWKTSPNHFSRDPITCTSRNLSTTICQAVYCILYSRNSGCPSSMQEEYSGFRIDGTTPKMSFRWGSI